MIDLDDPASWPPELRDLAEEAGRDDPSPYTLDLRPSVEAERRIREILDESGIVIYHCTRLLDSEVADLRANGVRACSEDLVDRKVAVAVAGGYLDQATGETIRSASVIRTSTAHRRGRLNNFCALSIRRSLDVDYDGLWRFFTQWGGEITYWAQLDNAEVLTKLRAIGTPAIVTLAMDTTTTDRFYPPIERVVVGRVLGLADCAGEVHVDIGDSESLPVLDVWRPGHCEYDRHTELPRQ